MVGVLVLKLHVGQLPLKLTVSLQTSPFPKKDDTYWNHLMNPVLEFINHLIPPLPAKRVWNETQVESLRIDMSRFRNLASYLEQCSNQILCVATLTHRGNLNRLGSRA